MAAWSFNIFFSYSYDIAISRHSWSAEPNQLDNQVGHQCQQDDYDQIDNATGFGDYFCSFVHSFLVLLQFLIVVFDFVEIYEHFAMEKIKTTANADCIGMDQTNPIKQIVHALFDHIVYFL